jgi:uncharacterized MAPEG superfamily protein
MKIAILVLALLCFMPYIMAGISGFYRSKQLGTVDNKYPRQQSSQLTGIGARAVAAQQNSWEALAVYSAAILAVTATGVEIEYLPHAAVAVLCFRILHAVFYLANLDKLRSLSFVFAIIPSFYLFYGAIVG